MDKDTDELYMCGLSQRLYLTFFLELAICTFLSLQVTDLSSSGTVVEWLISLTFLGFMLGTFGVLGYLTVRT